MTVQFTFKLEDEIDEVFRQVIYKKYGLNRGAIQTSLNQAVLEWIKKYE